MQLSQQQIDYCMECGVCTGSCPVAMTLEGFSPRQMIKRTLSEPQADILGSKDIWACLTCSRCSDRCPVEIDFPGFIRSYRSQARQSGNLPVLSHHGMFHTLTRIQAGNVRQNRIEWARKAGKISEKGDVFYFTGCIAYYDVGFQYLDLKMIQSAEKHVQLMNKMGVEPVVSNDECCCGHDAFWSGDEETFQMLAEKNLAAIAASKAETVVFGCPEGYSMFREAYTDRFGPLPFEILHMTEFLARELPRSGLSFKDQDTVRVTYQDPCRLGRRAGIYDAPRDLITMVPGTVLTEMAHNRENAVCCGTTAWMECSTCSKVMQVQRLKEAEASGAAAIVTACPKCRIHLTCAQKNTDHHLAILDLVSYVADHLA